jgi:DNA modification methylase
MQKLILEGDCIEVIKELIAQDVQVDSIVTDPPYELGFMGNEWDKSGIAYNKELWDLCLKILKPGGHLLAFGGSRTYHRMACAIENAGFEIRDQIMWIYGSGFPKSLDVSKAIDKTLGEDRPRDVTPMQRSKLHGDRPWMNDPDHKFQSNEPISNDAKQWQGFGTALKPAHEPIVLARKPLDEKTIAANVLKHGTGAINIDGSRITRNFEDVSGWSKTGSKESANISMSGKNYAREPKLDNQGRFPANLIHDGSDEVESEFAKYGVRKSGGGNRNSIKKNLFSGIGDTGSPRIYEASNGSASRFFYCAKASKKERNGSKHPTVKPLALMRYLCRLITPPGGTILDPFAGSGTTGQAANEEGFNVILIEKNEEYINDINKRLSQETQLELNDFAA